MKLYVVMAVLVAVMIGGYRVTESYRQLEDFHRRYLDVKPSVTVSADSTGRRSAP